VEIAELKKLGGFTWDRGVRKGGRPFKNGLKDKLGKGGGKGHPYGIR